MQNWKRRGQSLGHFGGPFCSSGLTHIHFSVVSRGMWHRRWWVSSLGGLRVGPEVNFQQISPFFNGYSDAFLCFKGNSWLRLVSHLWLRVVCDYRALFVLPTNKGSVHLKLVPMGFIPHFSHEYWGKNQQKANRGAAEMVVVGWRCVLTQGMAKPMRNGSFFLFFKTIWLQSLVSASLCSLLCFSAGFLGEKNAYFPPINTHKCNPTWAGRRLRPLTTAGCNDYKLEGGSTRWNSDSVSLCFLFQRNVIGKSVSAIFLLELIGGWWVLAWGRNQWTHFVMCQDWN